MSDNKFRDSIKVNSDFEHKESYASVADVVREDVYIKMNQKMDEWLRGRGIESEVLRKQAALVVLWAAFEDVNRYSPSEISNKILEQCGGEIRARLYGADKFQRPLLKSEIQKALDLDSNYSRIVDIELDRFYNSIRSIETTSLLNVSEDGRKFQYKGHCLGYYGTEKAVPDADYSEGMAERICTCELLENGDVELIEDSTYCIHNNFDNNFYYVERKFEKRIGGKDGKIFGNLKEIHTKEGVLYSTKNIIDSEQEARKKAYSNADLASEEKLHKVSRYKYPENGIEIAAIRHFRWSRNIKNQICKI